ncbi:HCNGP-like protein [Plasmodium malariae]|uniref:HCNGP-like protein n=1 Tax=Plasmodium malariae TaxID=5858 RepID=A0A1D3JK34_PLAMA|nr:HCNGP-like protein [Plasmodium malariae]SBT86755.1 HCNGP-like protein [Plasmodium malariae]
MSLVDYEISSDEESDERPTTNLNKRRNKKKEEKNFIENEKNERIGRTNSATNKGKDNNCNNSIIGNCRMDKNDKCAERNLLGKKNNNSGEEISEYDREENKKIEIREKESKEKRKRKIESFDFIKERDYNNAYVKLRKENLNMDSREEKDTKGKEQNGTFFSNKSNSEELLLYNKNYNDNSKDDNNYDNNKNYDNNDYYNNDEKNKHDYFKCDLKKHENYLSIKNRKKDDVQNGEKLIKDNIEIKKNDLKKDLYLCENSAKNFEKKKELDRIATARINILENNNIMNISVDENNFDDIFYLSENEYSETLNKKLDELSKLYELNLTINKNIINSKEYKNPCILEKIMEIYHVDVYSSNYPLYIYNPHDFLSIDLFNEKSNVTDQNKAKTKWSSIT